MTEIKNPYYKLPWNELPLKCGEDGKEYNNNMARYAHMGCPGLEYEDNCYEPSECAVRGKCKIAYEKMQAHLRKIGG